MNHIHSSLSGMHMHVPESRWALRASLAGAGAGAGAGVGVGVAGGVWDEVASRLLTRSRTRPSPWLLQLCQQLDHNQNGLLHTHIHTHTYKYKLYFIRACVSCTCTILVTWRSQAALSLTYLLALSLFILHHSHMKLN